MQVEVRVKCRNGLMTKKAMSTMDMAEQMQMCFVISVKADNIGMQQKKQQQLFKTKIFIFDLFIVYLYTKIMKGKNGTAKKKGATQSARRKPQSRKRTITAKKRFVFKKRDYGSGDGMLTTVWGPAMWHYLHTMSFNYPVNPTEKDKRNYRNFVLNLQNVLPCKYCRMNLTNNLKKMPLQMAHMESRDTFSRFIYELHETVNRMLKKKSNLSFCEVRERYEHFRSRCTKDEEKSKLFTFVTKSTATRKNRSKANANANTITVPSATSSIAGSSSSSTKEKGCTEPLYGKKSKCVIHIVPQEENVSTFQINKQCIKRRKPAPSSVSTTRTTTTTTE